MASQQNMNMGQNPMINPANMDMMYENVGMQNAPYSMGEQMPANSMHAGQALTYQAIYPEIYYKLKPFIEIARDLIFASGMDMPTQNQMEEMADGIYDDFCKMHPDMENYMGKMENQPNTRSDPPDPPYYGGFRPSMGFRRRGLGRDFIQAMLLGELLGRDGLFY